MQKGVIINSLFDKWVGLARYVVLNSNKYVTRRMSKKLDNTKQENDIYAIARILHMFLMMKKCFLFCSNDEFDDRS